MQKLYSEEKSKIILIVDDDTLVRRIIRAELENRNYGVIEAENGIEAMAIINEKGEHIDLVITDMLMPGMSGESLGQILQFSHLKDRILYMSGCDENITYMEEERRNNFIEKPFRLGFLTQKVQEAIHYSN